MCLKQFGQVAFDGGLAFFIWEKEVMMKKILAHMIFLLALVLLAQPATAEPIYFSSTATLYCGDFVGVPISAQWQIDSEDEPIEVDPYLPINPLYGANF
jgi:hypothetical protein